jgi:hypothetical protein
MKSLKNLAALKNIAALALGNRCRIVTPFIARGLPAGTDYFQDIKDASDQGLVPPFQVLDTGFHTASWPWPEITYTTSPLYSWQFAYWAVRNGKDGPVYSTNRQAPSVEVADKQVVTMGVYYAIGGPLIDTSSWSIYAMSYDDATVIDTDFVDKVTDQQGKTLASLTAGANDNLAIPTQPPTYGSAVVYAKDRIGTFYFSHWSVFPDFKPLVNPLAIAGGTSGIAVAFYRLGKLKLPPKVLLYRPFWWLDPEGPLVYRLPQATSTSAKRIAGARRAKRNTRKR